MALGEVHLGDIGTSIGGTVKDQDKNVLDVSTASVKKILFQPPSGTNVEKSASFITDGTDGLIHYVTIADDIDELGVWYFQGYVELVGGKWYTDIHSFEVVENIVLGT